MCCSTAARAALDKLGCGKVSHLRDAGVVEVDGVVLLFEPGNAGRLSGDGLPGEDEELIFSVRNEVCEVLLGGPVVGGFLAPILLVEAGKAVEAALERLAVAL